ncbi:hypothetical protein GGE66_000570 [Rhizobium leguminosarum]|uniref:Uncharacterized protein n=1 Tax=Rhizobium leguminosarum TaxID=384 RepID=A0A7X0DQS5_RHILE|nr:hypothetical protein [Rhizobium leguminosarum]
MPAISTACATAPWDKAPSDREAYRSSSFGSQGRRDCRGLLCSRGRRSNRVELHRCTGIDVYFARRASRVGFIALRLGTRLARPAKQGAKRVSVYCLLSRASRSRRRMACPAREATYTGLAARPGSTQRVTAPRSAECRRPPQSDDDLDGNLGARDRIIDRSLLSRDGSFSAFKD